MCSLLAELCSAASRLRVAATKGSTRLFAAAAEFTAPYQHLPYQVAEAFHQQPDLARIAVDPFMPVQAKTNIMTAIFKDSQATEITKRLFSEFTLWLLTFKNGSAWQAGGGSSCLTHVSSARMC